MIVELAAHGTHGDVDRINKSKWLDMIRAVDIHRARADFEIKYNQDE
jgi:hypothetical protein